MKKKIYEIQKEDFIVLLEEPNGDGNFRLDGLIVRGKPGIIFERYLNPYDEKEDGKTYLGIQDYAFKKLKEEADRMLEKFIAENIDDNSFYVKMGEYDYSFWSRNLSLRNEYPQTRKSSNLLLDDIGEGKVCLVVNNCECVFDFVEDKFTDIKYQYGSRETKTPLEVFYADNLYMILAVEQYRKGNAHKAYTELTKVGEFLKGKKSIKIKLKDGRILEFKKDSDISVNDIIERNKDNFFIDDNWRMKPRLKERLPVSELDCLQFSKQQYRINTENLVIE